MDLWVIAATAATVYVAQYLQNISKGKEKLPESLSEDFSTANMGSPRCPVSRLVQGKKQNDDSVDVRRTIGDGENPDLWERESTYEMELPSTCEDSTGNNNSANSHSLSSLMPEFPGTEHGDWKSSDVPVGDTQTYSSHYSFRTRTFLRRKCQNRRLFKPLSSLETCLLARFNDEQMTTEDYMLSTFPSPCTSFTRPLLVTDGTRVISRNGKDSFPCQVQNEDKSAHVRRIPLLAKSKSSVASNKMRSSIGKSASRRCVHAHGGNVHGTFKTGDLLILEMGKALNVTPFGFSGPYNAVLLLCLGIFIGITSSCIAGKKEVDKLKHELEQTKNLVQDLQDELEMKDSLSVKELENENMETQKNGDMEYVDDYKQMCDQEAGENSESMRKIEAELEAELERLEINISTSNIETRLSDLIEMEPGFAADFVEGELRVDRIRIRELTFDQTESIQDPSGKSTPESGNYVVSPRELVVRLHEVINSRLEGRIKELEIALEESQRKVEFLMESERERNPWTKLWEPHELMRGERDNNRVETQPFIMNLAGEALDAYNEVYEELMIVNDDSEEDDSPFEMHENRLHEEGGESFKNYAPRRYETHMTDPSRRAGEDLNFLRVQELPDIVGLSDKEEDEHSEFEDEIEKQLIKQIVEKTKQGSPVVLNAQKILFLMEDREQNL